MLTWIGQLILNISFNSEHDSSIAILRARCLESWFQKGLEMMKCAKVKSSSIEVRDSFKNPLLEFILNSMKQQLGAVRNAAKQAFPNILEICVLLYVECYNRFLYATNFHIRFVCRWSKEDPGKITPPVLIEEIQIHGSFLHCTPATLLVATDPINLADELLYAAKDASLCNQAKDTLNSLMT